MPVVFSVLGFLTFLILSPTRQPAGTVSLPGGSGGIGFDDLQFSRSLDLVLVPGGRTGNLDLVDPRTASVTSISGFSTSTGYKGGHGEGITSVSQGEGKLYVTDRSSRALCVVDATTRKIVARTKLAASPDYVRYVGHRAGQGPSRGFPTLRRRPNRSKPCGVHPSREWPRVARRGWDPRPGLYPPLVGNDPRARLENEIRSRPVAEHMPGLARHLSR